MQPRQVALLALVAALLGAFIYFYEIRGAADREVEDSLGKRLFPELEADAIERLEVTTEDGVMASLARDGDEWRLSAPIEFPASGTAVEAIVDTLVHAVREDSVTAGNDLAAFGLGEAAPKVAFEAGGARTTLELGRETPVGSNRYVRQPGGDTIDLVAAHRLGPLSVSLDDLRDGRVLPFETGAVDAVHLRWAEGSVDLARRDGVWWLVSPIEVLADAERVDRLLSDLAYLRAEGFVEEGVAGPLASAFESPLFAAELTSEAQPVASFSVAVPGDSVEGRMVVRGRDGHLFEVASERLDDWPRRVVDYRDKTLSRFDVAAARSFELVFNEVGEGGMRDTRIQAEFAGGGWVTSPEPMSPAAAAALVAALSHLEGIDVVADALGRAEHSALGFDPPRVALRVWGEGASGASAPVLADVALGRARAGIGIYARRADAEVIHLLDEALGESIPTSLAAFRTSFLDVPEPEEDGVDAQGDELDPADRGDDVEGVAEPLL